jgi:hypothetical protein
MFIPGRPLSHPFANSAPLHPGADPAEQLWERHGKTTGCSKLSNTWAVISKSANLLKEGMLLPTTPGLTKKGFSSPAGRDLFF